MRPKHKVTLFILFITYVYLLFFQLDKYQLFIGDEQIYSSSVISLLNGHVDRNNHPLFAKTIWYFFVAPAYAITGTDSPIFWRSGTILTTLFTLGFFFSICRKLNTSLKTSTYLTMTLALDPLFFSFGRTIHLDIPALCFQLASISVFMDFIRNKNGYRLIVVSALLLGLSIAAKFSALLIIPAYLFYLSRVQRRLSQITAFIVLMFLGILLGNSIYFFKNHGNTNIFTYLLDILISQNSFTAATAQASHPISWILQPKALNLYQNEIMAAINPLISVLYFPILGVALIKFLKQTSPEHAPFFILASLFQYFFWFFTSHPTYTYYFIPIIPSLLILVLSVMPKHIHRYLLLTSLIFFALSRLQ